MSSSISLSISQILKQLRSQPAVVTTIFVSIAIGVFAVSTLPRSVERASQDDLRAAVEQPSAARRNIRVERQGRIGPGPEGDRLSRVWESGTRFMENESPESINGIISGSAGVATSTAFGITPMPGEDPPHPFPMFLSFRHQQSIDDQISVVEGRPPAEREPVPMLVGDACPHEFEDWQELFESLSNGAEPPTDEAGLPIECELGELPHYEVVVSRVTADALGLELDQQMILRPDANDRQVFGLSIEDLDFQMVMSISGIIELSDSSEEFWYGDPDLHRPRIQENADLRIIRATGLGDPEQYGSLIGDTGATRWLYSWRQFVSPDLVEQADVDQVMTDLRAFQADHSLTVARPSDHRVVTLLPELLEAHLKQRQQTLSLMSTFAAGFGSTAIAAVLLLSILMAERQRSMTLLTRGRGASRGQLLMTSLYQALILAIPASVCGYMLGQVLLPNTDRTLPYRLAFGFSVAAVGAMVLGPYNLIRNKLGPLLTQADRRPSSSPRRLVFEASLIVLAVGALVLMRRRGAIDEPTAAGDFDALLAATPILVALAVGAVTLRLFPVVARWLAAAGGAAKGAAGFIGFKRVTGQRVRSMLPLGVIILCLTVAAFSTIAQQTINSGQQADSWQTVGAEYRINSFARDANLPSSIDLDAIPSVNTIAFGLTAGDALARQEFKDSATQLLALDVSQYSTLTEAAQRVPHLPAELTTPPSDPTEPLPVAVSTLWPRDVDFRIGDTFTLDLGRLEPEVKIVGFLDTFPNVELDLPFVIVDLEMLRSVSDLPLAPTVAYLDAPNTDALTVHQIIGGQTQSATVTARSEVLAELAEDPFVSWVSNGLRIVFAFSALIAVLVSISAIALTSAARAKDLAYLRTLGLVTRQATTITFLEQLPSLVIAVSLGTITGIATMVLIESAIDFDAFTGGVLPALLTAEPRALLASTLAVVAAVVVAVIFFVFANRNRELGQTLRVGDSR